MSMRIAPVDVGRPRWLSDVLAERVEELRHRFAEIPVEPSGIAALDRLLGPVRPGWSTLIASGPAVGRSTLAIQVAIRHASAGGVPMLVSSTLTSNDIALRVLAIEADVGLGKLFDARLTEHDWTRIGRVLAGSGREVVVAGGVRRARDLEVVLSQMFDEHRVPSMVPSMLVVDDVDALVNDPRVTSEDVFDLLESMRASLEVALILTFRLHAQRSSSADRADRLLDEFSNRVARNIVMLEPDERAGVVTANVIRTTTGATDVVDLVRGPRSPRFYGVADQQRTPHPPDDSTAASAAVATAARSDHDD